MSTTTMEPQVSVARERLKEAMSNAMAAKENAQEAEQALQEAVTHLKESRATLIGFADLNQRIAQFRTNASKAGIDPTLPSDLVEMERDRSTAEQEVQRSEAVAQSLEEKLASARDRLANAVSAHEHAAMRILAESIEGLIAELNEVNRRREYLHIMLKAVALPYSGWERIQPQQRRGYLRAAFKGLGLPDGSLEDWERLHTLASTAINNLDRVRMMPMKECPIAAATNHWAAFANSLLADPAAPPAPLPTWESLFFSELAKPY